MLVDLPDVLQATGTENASPEAQKTAQRQAQRAGRETRRQGALASDGKTKPTAQKESPKPLRIADLSDDERRDATNSGGGTRTPDTRIMIPLL